MIIKEKSDEVYLIAPGSSGNHSSVAREIKMLRWMCGVTKENTIRNEHVTGLVEVALVAKKITEKGLM